MELIKDVVDNGKDIEGKVFFNLFDRYIRFSASRKEPKPNLDYINQCAVYLNSLSDDLINRLCRSSIMYCNYYLEEYLGEEPKKFASDRDVLALITPLDLMIPDMKENEPIAHLELNCEWEPEHGMEWIVRGDRLLYVGCFESEDPWGEYPDSERLINGGNYENFAC